MLPATCSPPAPITIGHFAGHELHSLFNPVLAHASTEMAARVPGLTLISCEIEHGVFYAVATDRYTLGISRHPLPDDQPPTNGSITVPAATLRRVLAAVRRRDQLVLSMAMDGLTITLTSESPLTFHISASPMDFFIPWRTLMGSKLRMPAAVQAAPVSMAPSMLARFASAVRDGLPLEFRHLQGKYAPVLVTCGTHFAGLLMPVRNNTPTTAETSVNPLDTWLSAFPAPDPDSQAA
ncbi:hypothetical protein ACIBG7_40315 [Nonomuraea sp. NPDC050328]|uniref:hypothetical protein n=1 Tax=Nonomuraea sp. NPDC050328 TaxID=3364361 RepID=UPI0037ADAD5C